MPAKTSLEGVRVEEASDPSSSSAGCCSVRAAHSSHSAKPAHSSTRSIVVRVVIAGKRRGRRLVASDGSRFLWAVASAGGRLRLLGLAVVLVDVQVRVVCVLVVVSEVLELFVARLLSSIATGSVGRGVDGTAWELNGCASNGQQSPVRLSVSRLAMAVRVGRV